MSMNFADVLLSPLKGSKSSSNGDGGMKSAIDVFEEARRMRQSALYGDGSRKNIRPRRHNSKELVLSSKLLVDSHNESASKLELDDDDFDEDSSDDEDDDEEKTGLVQNKNRDRRGSYDGTPRMPGRVPFVDEPSEDIIVDRYEPTRGRTHLSNPYAVEQTRKRKHQMIWILFCVLFLAGCVVSIVVGLGSSSGEKKKDSGEDPTTNEEVPILVLGVGDEPAPAPHQDRPGHTDIYDLIDGNTPPQDEVGDGGITMPDPVVDPELESPNLQGPRPEEGMNPPFEDNLHNPADDVFIEDENAPLPSLDDGNDNEDGSVFDNEATQFPGDGNGNSNGNANLGDDFYVIANFIKNHGITPMNILEDSQYTQHKAVQYLVDELESSGGVNIDFGSNFDAVNAKKFVERYILAVLYYHFNGDHSWTSPLQFLSLQDHCQWNQVNPPHGAYRGTDSSWGVECNDDGFVTKLNLSQNGLTGHTLPNEMKFLEHLESLHLHKNDINGGFPNVLKELTSIKSLLLMDTQLTGQLPDWIGDMNQLTTLALGHNLLSGQVPPSITKLDNLEILGLNDNNGLSGNLNLLFEPLASLTVLYLENNAFTGHLPATIKLSWPYLSELDLSDNSIDGPFPSSMLALDSLIVLDLHNNLLTGTFPTNLGPNYSLKVLSLSDNHMEGNIPQQLAMNLQNLHFLDLSLNRFNGIIPDNLYHLTDLQHFATSRNAFSRQPFPMIDGMTNLISFNVKHNNIEGSVPTYIGSLTNLETLDLESNDLTGMIPTTMGLLSDLENLLLNGNELIGNIPHEMANLESLDVLTLDDNSLFGSIDVICNIGGDDGDLEVLTADCLHGTAGEPPEIECHCCTKCCSDNDSSCSDFTEWTNDFEPEWEFDSLRLE